MGEATVVHVLRHGEVHNPASVLYGRLPGYHLSDLGLEMAERIAERLCGEDITLRRLVAAGAGPGDGARRRPRRSGSRWPPTTG